MDRQVTIESVKLVEQLKKIFPKDGYHLISLQEKFYIWEKYMDISKDKPIEEYDTGIKTKDLLSPNEKKFYENLHGNIKPENLINFNLKPKLIENSDDTLSKTLILGEDFINTKNQRVLKFTFLNFRGYDIEELKQKKFSEKDFIDSLVNSFHPNSVDKIEVDESEYYFFETEKIVIPGIIILAVSILFMI
ncbi:MAG: hypothetical protein ACRC8M_04965 [Cetobacterium sp.]|uniref:hypothetical protein n=1 Tax=Cetobacterium sp. TaxID=2071632 RepID=UPI003F38835E